ncbi:hypothetical protein NPS01_00220 [Nocardioides psychrotolerans]|uniref:Response regulator receiver domain-containing protein n=1 Tax=Nocardioides psychrotolerans TaxID=1005945 RepID=A0A1I3BZR6_9ACTN|nr:response regulator [Nocardioides psychrotolerans]GEP36359.1 hypothetical protein NPS01_00220 [Nocardioides psychrotolerans]SFH67805.1 Response regulator receiver domain-containing protein [Nocardioides psychrotolerans]
MAGTPHPATSPPVLVASADPARAAALATALAAGGLANPVRTATSVRDAVDLLLGIPGRTRDRVPVVVVTDHRFPDGSGVEVLRAARGHLQLRRTPVVVVGHDATEAELDEMHRLGVSAYLNVGVAAVALLDVVRRLPLPWSLAPAPAVGAHVPGGLR